MSKCAGLIGLDWNYVTDCYESDKGTLLQLQAEEDTTSKITPSFIPSILYNGVSGLLKRFHMIFECVHFRYLIKIFKTKV